MANRLKCRVRARDDVGNVICDFYVTDRIIDMTSIVYKDGFLVRLKEISAELTTEEE